MLKLSDEERKTIKDDLQNIVQMFDKLSELDTDGVEPRTHINIEPQKLASDIPETHLDRKIALENSDNTEGNFFTVPKIIK